MSNIIQIKEEYLYTTIPKDYVYVYYSILTMLAELGEDMLKDCKATCKDRNSGIIECKNMFDAAIAARKLGNIKLADTIIKYLKAKINQILGTKNEFVSYDFPVNGGDAIKYIVDTNNNPIIKIDDTNADAYRQNLLDIISNCILSLNRNFDMNFGQTVSVTMDNRIIIYNENTYYASVVYKDNIYYVPFTSFGDYEATIEITPTILTPVEGNAYKDEELLFNGYSGTTNLLEDCELETEVVDANSIKYAFKADVKVISPAYGGDGETLDDILGSQWFPLLGYNNYEGVVSTAGNTKILFAIPKEYGTYTIYLKSEGGTIYRLQSISEITIGEVEYNVHTFNVPDNTIFNYYINK